MSIEITITHVAKDGRRTSEHFVWEGGLVQFVRLTEDFSRYIKPSSGSTKHAPYPALVANPDRIAEGPLQSNVIAALRRALAEHPEGCLEARLWHGVEACGVARGVFDEAVEIMLTTGWSRRRHGRLFSGTSPLAEPRLAIPSDTEA